MPAVRALRGVCIGVNRNLAPGDVEDIDAALAQFLIAIRAVELLPEPKPEPVIETPAGPQTKAPELSGKKEK